MLHVKKKERDCQNYKLGLSVSVTHTHARTHGHTHARTHAHTHTQTHTHARTQERARAHTHAHTQVRARIHTHTHKAMSAEKSHIILCYRSIYF